MITLHYVLYAAGEAAPTAEQIVSGLAWGPAVAAGSDVPRTSPGDQSFPEVSGLPRGEYRVAFVAYDDEEDEYSNVVVSAAQVVPRMIARSVTGATSSPWVLYPPAGDVPLTEPGFSVQIAEFANPAPILGSAEVDIVDGAFELVSDDVLMEFGPGQFLLLLFRKGDIRGAIPGETDVESEPWL